MHSVAMATNNSADNAVTRLELTGFSAKATVCSPETSEHDVSESESVSILR
jgi:hypothetical protein